MDYLLAGIIGVVLLSVDVVGVAMLYFLSKDAKGDE